jgi:hypothetical protein
VSSVPAAGFDRHLVTPVEPDRVSALIGTAASDML